MSEFIAQLGAELIQPHNSNATVKPGECLISSVASRLFLEPQYIWPPSTDSAPFLVTTWGLLVFSLYMWFFREKANKLYTDSLIKRREEQMKKIKNLVFIENLRLQKLEKEKDSADFDSFSNFNEIETKSKDPANAEAIFEIIFDKIEDTPIATAIDICHDDAWYLRAVTFFKCRLRAELIEAVEHTQEAQKLAGMGMINVSNEQQIILDYVDGEKLARVIEFTKEKAIKHFGEHTELPPRGQESGIVSHFDAKYLPNNESSSLKFPLFDDITHSYPGMISFAVLPEPVKNATAVIEKIRSNRRHALMFIFDILRPVLPCYGLSVLFMLFARAFEAPLWAHSFPNFKASIARINPDATVTGEFGFGPDILASAKVHALLFAVGFVFSRPIEMLASSFGDKAARDFTGPLRKSVLHAILKQDTEYFDFNSAAVLQERLNRDTDELVSNMLWIPRQTLEFTFRVTQRIMTLYFVSPAMLRACLYFNVPLFTIVIISTSRPLRRLWGQRDRSSEEATKDTLEILQKVRTVRQFNMEKEEEAKYSLGNIGRNVFETRIRVLESFTHNLRFMIHIAGEIYVIYMALVLCVDGEAEVQDAIVASTVGMWLQHDMKNLMQQVPKLLQVMKPLHRVSTLLACQPRIEQANISKSSKDSTCLLKPAKFKGEIKFENVTFSYPKERTKQVLNNLSFTASPGQKVAFVGKTGCGKSTAIDLLQRFYDRTGGEIFVDGRRIEEYDVHYLRKHCGVVSQTNVLFNRSIYENIVYGMKNPPAAESKEFLDVCQQAQAWEFIRKFPNMQYTVVGDDGVNLSGGQKQRIAVARVIIRKPTFLFLDEATSALDAINEKAVQQALDSMLAEFNGVAIVVAHSLTTIYNCDKIVVLGDNGNVVEQGTHTELLKVPKQLDEDGNPVSGPGLYHTLWDTQQVVGNDRTSDQDDEMACLDNQIQVQEEELQKLRKQIRRLRTYQFPDIISLRRASSSPM